MAGVVHGHGDGLHPEVAGEGPLTEGTTVAPGTERKTVPVYPASGAPCARRVTPKGTFEV
jgi:hypothetical protein